jgi:hypothetical protein
VIPDGLMYPLLKSELTNAFTTLEQSGSMIAAGKCTTSCDA